MGFILFAVIALIAPAFGEAQSKSGLKQGDSPLIFRIELPEKTRCKDSCLTVRAVVVNVGDKKLAIDTNGLKYQIALDKFRQKRDGAAMQSKTTTGDYGPTPYDETTYKILLPGELYKTTISISFSDEFFSENGPYTVSVTYGQFREYTFQGAALFKGTVQSNKVDFSIQSCGERQLRKSLQHCK